MKKHIIKFLFSFFVIICFSFNVSAQKTEEKKGERKPPTIIVPDKDKKNKDYKEKNKDKKDDSWLRIVSTFVKE